MYNDAVSLQHHFRSVEYAAPGGDTGCERAVLQIMLKSGITNISFTGFTALIETGRKKAQTWLGRHVPNGDYYYYFFIH